MKVALIALVLAVSFAASEAYWGYGYGGLWGGLGSLYYGGLYNGYYGGLYGGWGYGYWGKRDTTQTPPAELLNRTECAYFAPTGVLSCHGPRGLVECGANVTWPMEFEYQLFGVGLFDETTTMRYRLLPRRLDNTAWERGVWTDEGVERFASLYTTEENQWYGLRVRDEKCYTRLVELFRESNRREPTVVNGETKPVYVVGDLMVSNELPENLKRSEYNYERRNEYDTERRWDNTYERRNEYDTERRWDNTYERRNEYGSEKRWDGEFETTFKRFTKELRSMTADLERTYRESRYPEEFYETRSDNKRHDMWTRDFHNERRTTY